MKYYLVPIFALLQMTICNQSVTAQADTVFFDNFDDNRNDWLLSNTENNVTEIANGNYVLNRKTKGNLRRTQFVFFDRESDFSIEVKFKVNSQGEYGIMWGVNDDDNNFNFTIRKNKYSIYSYAAAKYVCQQDFIAHDAISETGNTLKVVRSKDKVQYYINNAKVNEATYQKMPGRRFGITLWNATKVEADYILIMGKTLPINLVPDVVYNTAPENLGPAVNSEYDELVPVI